jgi:hypothetical protein
VINGTGALTTALVTLIVVATKFTQGAWIVTLLVPSLVGVFYWVHRHYGVTRAELAIDHLPERPRERPQVIVPVAAEDDPSTGIQDRWSEWAGEGVPLRILESPYREVVSPLVDLVEDLADRAEEPVTVVIPTIVPAHLWQEPLHNQIEYALSLALIGKPNVVIASVPVRLRGTAS